jgi:hypothetical protein
MDKLEITADKLHQARKVIQENVPVVMLNLLRYKEKADYGENSGVQLSGAEAYFQHYIPSFVKVMTDLDVKGVNPLWIGNVLSAITDSEDIAWDNVALMEYQCFEDFCTIIESSLYKDIAEKHRFAALAETKLIVLIKADFGLPK